MKVGIHLSHVNSDNSAAGFEFDNNSAIDDQIQMMLSNHARAVSNLNQLFPLDSKPAPFQFCNKSATIDAFDESWTKFGMNFPCRFKNSVNQSLVFHALR